VSELCLDTTTGRLCRDDATEGCDGGEGGRLIIGPPPLCAGCDLFPSGYPTGGSTPEITVSISGITGCSTGSACWYFGAPGPGFVPGVSNVSVNIPSTVCLQKLPPGPGVNYCGWEASAGTVTGNVCNLDGTITPFSAVPVISVAMVSFEYFSDTYFVHGASIGADVLALLTGSLFISQNYIDPNEVLDPVIDVPPWASYTTDLVDCDGLVFPNQISCSLGTGALGFCSGGTITIEDYSCA